MRYIEPHAHMVSRTTDDYIAMAASGCAAVSEPAFWAGYDRGSADGFHDYFLQLTEYEPRRAAKYGMAHFCWLCINPKESEDIGLAKEVLAMIPEFIDKPNVLGIGKSALTRTAATNSKCSKCTSTSPLATTNSSSSTPHTSKTNSKAPGSPWMP